MVRVPKNIGHVSDRSKCIKINGILRIGIHYRLRGGGGLGQGDAARSAATAANRPKKRVA